MYIVFLFVGSFPGENAVSSGALDLDGFPGVGTYLTDGVPYYRSVALYYSMLVMLGRPFTNL